ncbi:hypothetical protein ABPG73_017511, partial [Tetrahymena malaccensis]
MINQFIKIQNKNSPKKHLENEDKMKSKDNYQELEQNQQLQREEDKLLSFSNKQQNNLVQQMDDNPIQEQGQILVHSQLKFNKNENQTQEKVINIYEIVKNVDENPKNIVGQIKDQQESLPIYQLFNNQGQVKNDEKERKSILNSQSQLSSLIQSEIQNRSFDLQLIWNYILNNELIMFLMLATDENIENLKIQATCNDTIQQLDKIWPLKDQQSPYYFKLSIKECSKNNLNITFLLEKQIQPDQSDKMKFKIFFNCQKKDFTFQKVLNGKQIKAKNINDEQILSFIKAMFCCFGLYDFINYFSDYQLMDKIFTQSNLETVKQHLINNNSLIMNYLMIASNFYMEIQDFEFESYFQKLADYLIKERKNNDSKLNQKQVLSKEIFKMKKKINDWFQRIRKPDLIEQLIQFQSILDLYIGYKSVYILLQNQKYTLMGLFQQQQQKQINLDYKTWFEIIKEDTFQINNLAQLQEYIYKNQQVILKLIQDQEKKFMTDQKQSLVILIRKKINDLIQLENKPISAFKIVQNIDQIIQTKFVEDQIKFLNNSLQKFNLNNLNQQEENEIKEIVELFSQNIQAQALENILVQLNTFEENQHKQIIQRLFVLYYKKLDKKNKFQQNQFCQIARGIYQLEIQNEKSNKLKFEKSFQFIQFIIRFQEINFDILFDNIKKIFKYAYENLEKKTFIQEFNQLNLVLKRIDQFDSKFSDLSTYYQEKLVEFLKENIIKYYLSQQSFLKLLDDLVEDNSLKQEFQDEQIFQLIIDQLHQIKKPDLETIFSDDFYSRFVFMLSNDSLFKKNEFYIFCTNLARKFQNIEDIEWGIIQHYINNEEYYTQFLNAFNIKQIVFSKNQKQIIQNASQKLFKVEQFFNILTKIFSVQASNNTIQNFNNLKKTYNKTKWSNISQNKDLEELNNYQDIIQISSDLYNSIVFKTVARQYSQKNQIEEIYQTIKQQIIPIIFYTAKQVSIGTEFKFFQKVSQQSISSSQYISQQVVQEQPNLQSYIYILEKYLIEINQEEEEQEMEYLNNILKFIFSDSKSNDYICSNLVGEFMENSRQIYRQIQITQQVMQISKSVQIDIPEQLDLIFKQLNQLQQENENTYQQMLMFQQQNINNCSWLYENVEDIQLKLIPILKNYSNILNKWDDQTLNDLKLSDEQDIAEQINCLIYIKKKLIEFKSYEQVQKLDKEKNLNKLLQQVSIIINSIEQDQALVKQIEGVSISFQKIKDYLEEQQGGQSSISVMNQFLELGKIIITFQDIQGRVQEEIVFQNMQGDNDNKHKEIKERKQYFDDLVKYSQHIAQTIIQLDEEGSLEDQISQITIQIKDNKPKKIIEELIDVARNYEHKIYQWNQTLQQVNNQYPVLQLIPLRLLRKFSYYIFNKFMQEYKNEQFQVSYKYSPKQIQSSITIQQNQFDFKNFMIKSNCQNFLQMIFINPKKINFKAFENDLTLFNKPNSEAQNRIEVIAKILQDAFTNNKGIQLIKGHTEHLQICRKQVTDYQDCIKFLLRFPSIQAYQVLICNQDTNFQDISCFFKRATKFEITQKKQTDYEKYFLCNFDQLNYISQQKTIKLINQINSEYIKSQNKIFIIYKDQRDQQQLQNIVNYQIVNDAWQDFLQINHDDGQYEDQVSVNKKNIFTYTSKRAGEGKTYQIQQKILSETKDKQYVRVPLHQFENLDSFISNIIKNTPNNELQKYYHLDVCYDETDEVSLLLYQILMLNCVCKNSKTVYLLSPNSVYYVEKSNFFNKQYIQFLDLINNQIKNDQENIYKTNVVFSLNNFVINSHQFSQHQIAFQYLKISMQSENSFYFTDYFQNQKEYQKVKAIDNKEASSLLIKLFEGIDPNELTFSRIQMFIQQLYCKLELFESIELFKLDYIKQMQQNAEEQKQNIFENVRNHLIKTIIKQSLNSTLLIEQKNQNQKQKKKHTLFQICKLEEINILQINESYESNKKQKLLSLKSQNCKQYFQQCFNVKDYKLKVQSVKKQIDEQVKLKDLQQNQLQNLLSKKYQKLNFKIDLDPQDNEIREKNKMKKYNNLDKDVLALKVNDFIIVTQIKNQSTQQMQQIIKFLEQYLQIYNKIKQKKDNLTYEMQFPDFQQNQQDSLAQIVVNIVCEEPGQFYNLETKKNNENLQKILSNFVFSPDNAFKMVLISFRIQAGLPVIIMGETGIGKTYCIKLLSQLMKYEFRVIEIDSGLHVDKIVNAILEYQNDQKWDNEKVIIFLDEVNTTYCVNGIIKEIIIDRHINGMKIKDNIVFVAACNPYQYKKYKIEQDNQQENNNHQLQQQIKKSYQLEYKVKPLCESFSYCIINFKSLSEEQELLYIENLINMYKTKNEKCNINYQDTKQLKILIFQSQLFIRKESCERSVSLRDTYFRIKLENEKNNLDQNALMIEVKQKSIIIALYMVYYLRLQIQVKRDLYLKFYEYLVKQNSFPIIKFKQTVDEELNWLTNECGIQSQYIAKNNALQENIFCIIICLLNKIPLIITGEPGTSKTLSFSIALSCLKGNTQSKFFQSQPTIKEFYYQGNPQTTSKHIQDVFNQARKYQASVNSKFQVIPLVVIDEIGQGERNKNNPNKILHYQLENCDIAFLAISNIDLDVSNMNRCLHLYRQIFTEQDLKDFIGGILKGFKNFAKDIKDEIFQIAQIYHKFQQQKQTQKHGTRDFYYTVKYTCHKINVFYEQNIQTSKQEAQKLIAQAFYKNFGGDTSNQQFIMKLVKEQFQLEDHTLSFSQTDLISESIDSINNGDFYHSRFLMLVTKDPISCTNYVQSLFKQYDKSNEVFMGSHFRDDHTIDLSKDISKLNSRIEQGINVISVLQYYLYTIYYDFFTMNFIRMGENNTFRISYKQFSKRVQVKPDFIFVIIAHQDEYEHMDPALLNRFEKYTINLKDLLGEADKKLLVELKKEIRQLENVQSNMKLFTFSSESELYSLVIQQRQQYGEINESLKQKCLSKLGDLTFRTYIFHNKKNENNNQYKDWLNRSYLDNLLSYLHHQRQQIDQNQLPFKSIIYTTSFTHDKYKQLIDQKGFNSKIINLKIYPTKDLFIQQLEDFYNKGTEDLLVIAVDQIYESYKNLCYLQYELQYQHSLYHQKNKKLKSIILTIQLSSLNVKGLAFCENWNQVQIENLLPYVYTVPVNLSHGILEKANQKLNYRYLTNNNIITILTEKSEPDIFQYFMSTPGFFASLMTSIQINDNQTQNQSNQNKYTYLNNRISYFKKIFSFYEGVQSDYKRQFLQVIYEQFERKIRIDQNYDAYWSKNIQFPNLIYKKDGQNKKINKIQLIPIINFEKILINQLRSYVVEQLSEIIVIMEKKNFIIESLITEDQINIEQRKCQIEMIKEYFQNFEYRRQNIIKILQKIPKSFKLIQSKQIYKKIEESKFHMQPLTYKYIQEDKISLNLYIEDFLIIKSFLPAQLKEIIQLLVEQNKLQSFKSIHEFCWDYEDTFTKNAELVKSLQIDTFTDDFKQFIIKNNFNINKEQLNQFFRDTSFSFITNQPLQKNVSKFTQLVNIFVMFYSSDHIDSQILIYLQKLRGIVQDQQQYEDISQEILQNKLLGILKLKQYIFIQELPQIEQLKFYIKFNHIHLNLNFINDKERQIYNKQFLYSAFAYLQHIQINSDKSLIDSQIRSIIKQGISLIVEQYIQQNQDNLLTKIMQELQPQQLNNSHISSILRQFFDEIKIPIASPLSVIFIETFFNELSAANKNIILQSLNFVTVYNAFKNFSNDHANLGQFIAVSCLKILSQYLIDPLKYTMEKGILEFQIQNNTFIDLLTLMSQSFEIEDPQKNPFHNHIILSIINSLSVSLIDYANILDKNKWNLNQLNFIYQFISKQKEYQNKLEQLMADKENCINIFKVAYDQSFTSDKFELLNLSLIFNNSSEINEQLLNQSKEAIEKILDQTDVDVSQFKLFELIWSQESQHQSIVFKEINQLINIQNKVMSKLQNQQEKFILDTNQSDFIEIKSDLFDQKHIYIFSDEQGKVNYEELENYYNNEFLEHKPQICGLNKIEFKFKQQVYELDLLYHNLQVSQEKLSLEKIQNLEDLNIDSESCLDVRSILIKLNQILKIKGNKKGDSEILITKLLEINNEKEELDHKIIQILDTITCKYLCSLIQYFESKIMDYLISQLLKGKQSEEYLQQDQTLNQIIQLLEKNQIQLNDFKNLIGKFILRLNKNFQVDSLPNNIFQNIFDPKYNEEFFSSIDSPQCSQDLKSQNHPANHVENKGQLKFKDEDEQFQFEETQLLEIEQKPQSQSDKQQNGTTLKIQGNSIMEEEQLLVHIIPKFAVKGNQVQNQENKNGKIEKNLDENPKNVLLGQIKEQQNSFPIYQLFNKNQSLMETYAVQKESIQNQLKTYVQSGNLNINGDLQVIWKCILNNDLIIFLMLDTKENMENIKLQATCNDKFLQLEKIWPLYNVQSPEYYFKLCIKGQNKDNLKISVFLEKKISKYLMQLRIQINPENQSFVLEKILNNEQIKTNDLNNEQLSSFIEKMFCCFGLYDFINYFSDYQYMHKLLSQANLEKILKQYLNNNNSLIMNYLLIASNLQRDIQFDDFELSLLFQKLSEYLKKEEQNNYLKLNQQQVFTRQIQKMKKKINDWFQRIYHFDLIEQFIQFQNVLGLSIGQQSVSILLQKQKYNLNSLFQLQQQNQIQLDYKIWIQIINQEIYYIQNLSLFQAYIQKNKSIILKMIQDQEKFQPHDKKLILVTLIRQRINDFILIEKKSISTIKLIQSIDSIIQTRFIEDQINFLNTILQRFNLNNTLNLEDRNEIQEIMEQFSNQIQVQAIENILRKLNSFEENKQIIQKLLELFYLKINQNDKQQQNNFLEIVRIIYNKEISNQYQNENKLEKVQEFIFYFIKFDKIDQKIIFDHIEKLFKYVYENFERKTFISDFSSLNNILESIQQSYFQLQIIIANQQENLRTFLKEKIIKQCISKEAFQKLLYDLTQLGSLKQEFQDDKIFESIVEQLHLIKKPDPEAIFSDDFYSMFVFLLSNDSLFKKHWFYTQCLDLAKRFLNIEDLEWGIIQHYMNNKDHYTRFLSVFSIDKIKFNKKQKIIFENASQKVYNVEQFVKILTNIFQVQKSNHTIQKCFNLNKTYNKTKWSKISQDKDLEELDNYQDIIQISYQLSNSIVFKSVASQYSFKNQIDEVYQTIKYQIMPILFYTAKQVSIGTGFEFSQRVSEQNLSSNQYISQQVIQDQPNLQSFIYILEKYLININQNEEKYEMQYLNDILEFIFSDLKINQFIDQCQVTEFMKNSRQFYRQIQITQQIMQISKSFQVQLPDQLDQVLIKLNKQKQENENTYQQMMEFQQQNLKNFQYLYEIVEDNQLKLIPILKNYSNILNKWNDQTLNDLKLSDDQDIAEQINWLICIKKKLIEHNAYEQVQKLENESNLISLLKLVSDIINSTQQDQALIKQIEGVSISFQRIKDHLDEQQGGQSSISVMNQFLEQGKIIISFQDIQGRLQEEIIFQIEESLKISLPLQQAQINNKQQQGQKQNSSSENKTFIKIFDMDEIYSIQSRLNLQVQNIQEDNFNKNLDIKEKKDSFDDLVKYSQHISQTIINLDEDGSLEDQIQQITIQIKNNNPKKIIKELQELISIYKLKIREWNQTLQQVFYKYPILQLIPLHLLRKFSYYIFKKYMQFIDQNEQFEVNNTHSSKKINSITIQKVQFDLNNFMIESNCQNFLQMIFINIKKINFKTFENELTIFSDPDSEAQHRIEIIAKILQDVFSKSNGIQLIKGHTENLQICRKQVSDYQECIKFLLRFPSIQAYQVLFCNQDTNFQDISCFFLRATKFEIVQKQIHCEKYFLCNFDKLNYISQQKTIRLINQINQEFIKSQNKLYIIYKDERDKQQLQKFANYQIVNDAWQDFLQINNDDNQYEDQASVSKGNIFTYTSKRAGEGKSYQIQKRIQSETQKSQYIRVPLHQFDNLDLFISNIIKRTANNELQRYYHLDVCYDETDEVSLLLYQILMLNCVCKNFKSVYLLSSNSVYYVEKSNFFDKQYVQFLDLINNQIKNDQKLNFEIDLDPQDNEIREKNKMKKYNNLDKDVLALKVDDFIIVTQIKNQQTQQMQQIIKFLEQYLQIYNKIKQKKDSCLYQMQFPDFQQNQQDSLAQIVVNIVCEEPGQFYNLETKKNNENLQKILSNFVFSPDNAFKMVLMSFRIQAGLPVIIMGETGIGKTYCIKLLAQLMKYEFRVIEIDSGLQVDKIVNAILEYQNDQKWDNEKVIIFLDEVNTTYCVNGIIKEIIIDRHINGMKIKDNIVFVAACNPYQYKKYKIEQDNQQENNNHQLQQQIKKSYQLEYKVKPLRESFSYCIINFKNLSEEQELLYIENLINMYKLKNKKCDINQQDIEQLKILIIQSQLFIRKESCERSVSLRDVNRFLVLFFYFYQTYFRIKLENNNDQKIIMKEVKQKSIILALYMVYYLRLQIQVKRDLYLKYYEYLVTQNQFPNIKFKQTVDEELNWLTNECGIQSQYIAKNNALQENVFCIIICLLNKIPLIITGEPGTSKTLSFSIALSCLKGNTQSKFFLSQPKIKEFYYQGNPQTTSKHIQDVFNQARKYLASINSKFQVIPLVVIDEIGQGEANKTNPNKILHYQLENCDVAFLAISNIDLDVSNMNRCLHLYRQRFTEQDLKNFIEEIMKGFQNFKQEIKDEIFQVNLNTKIKLKNVSIFFFIQIAQIYHKFQQGQKTQKHGTRDFYYTVKYTCHKLKTLIGQNTFASKQEAQKIIAKAFFKNFGGDTQNQQIIMNLVKNTFQLDNQILQINQTDLISENIQSINNGDFYHSRFLMLITKDPISCTNYVQSLFKKYEKKNEVFMGSHFRDDHTIDLSKDISKLNSRIEQGINVISVQQYYLYTIYYDFFTMNLIRMGENNTFRISYKQFSKRVQVKPDFIFVIIAHQDEYEHMDPALLNRFEKYTINLKDLLGEADKKLLVELKKEIRQLENNQSNMKLFTFSSESELYSLVIQQRQQNGEINESLKQQCLNKLGDLTFRTYIFHNKKNENNTQYKDWLNRSYLDNLLSYLHYQKQQINEKQQPFKSVIYTTSFTHDKYKQLIDKQGFNSKIINLKIYPTKDLFIQQLEDFYNKGDEDLLVIAVDQIYESYKNLCYLQYELQYQHSFYHQKNKKLKSIILTIQIFTLSVKGLAFCENWNQVQIENLLPYVYTVPVNLSHGILEKANQKLNYRYLTSNNIITILTEKSDSDILFYFMSTPGFFASLMTSIQINEDQTKNQIKYNKYTYLNNRISYFKKLFSFYDGVQSDYQRQFLQVIYEQFEKKIRIDQNYDDYWSKNIQFPNLIYKKDEQNKKINKNQSIPIINFEKIVINQLKSYIIDQVSEIVVIMEKKNFIIESLITENQINIEQRKYQIEMMKEYFQNFEYKRQNIKKILQKIPQPFKLIQSKQIYKKIEESKYHMQPLKFKNTQEDKVHLNLYIEDFLTIKSFIPPQLKEVLLILVEKNQLHSFQSIHKFCWDYEDIFTKNYELVKNLQVDIFKEDFKQFMIKSNFRITIELLNKFFRDSSFSFIVSQSLHTNFNKFTQNVSVFIKFYSSDHIDSQILIYLQKLRDIIPVQYLYKYQEISQEIVLFKSHGFLKLYEQIDILELSKIEQIKFCIKFNFVHLNLSFINSKDKAIYIKNFLKYAFSYLEQCQSNSYQITFDSQIRSIIKQGLSAIVVQYIEQNKDQFLTKLMQELHSNQINTTDISSILRQFFDENKIPIASSFSIIFIETFFNELTAFNKYILLQSLNYIDVYQIFQNTSNGYANLCQFIAVSCLKILSQYLIDPIKETMQNGILKFQIQNKTFMELLTKMSQTFEIEYPQKNPFHNHIIISIIDSLPNKTLIDYASNLDKNQWNLNQLNFIYKSISNNGEYQIKLKIQYIYPIISLIKIIYEKYAYKFDENYLQKADLSLIFDNNSEINESQIKKAKIAIEK